MLSRSGCQTSRRKHRRCLLRVLPHSRECPKLGQFKIKFRSFPSHFFRRQKSPPLPPVCRLFFAMVLNRTHHHTQSDLRPLPFLLMPSPWRLVVRSAWPGEWKVVKIDYFSDIFERRCEINGWVREGLQTNWHPGWVRSNIGLFNFQALYGETQRSDLPEPKSLLFQNVFVFYI